MRVKSFTVRFVVGLPLVVVGILAFATESWAQISEIIVTTRKREEALQKVPIAVDTISSQQIEQRGLANIDDITRQTSSVIFQQGFSPQDVKITIRGLSPDRGRQNVAILLDGVDITGESVQTVGASLLANPELFDVERVEIVKGPQNALYGRSAYNGAISYITRQPSDNFEGSVAADVGSDGQLKGIGRISGPLVEGTLFGGLTGMAYTHDGFYANRVTSADVGGRDGWAASGTLKWAATDAFSARLGVTYSDDDYEVQPWVYVNPNTQFAIPAAALSDGVTVGCTDADAAGYYTTPRTWPTATTNCSEPVPTDFPSSVDVSAALGIPGLIPLQPGFAPGTGGKFPDASALGNAGTMSEDPWTCSDPLDVATCRDFEGATNEVTRVTLHMDWDLGPVALSSITAYSTADTTQNHDSNANGSTTTLPFLAAVRFATDTDTFGEELRLQSTADNKLDWTVGAQYWQEDLKQRDSGSTCISVVHPFAPSAVPHPPFFAHPNGYALLPCGPFVWDTRPNGGTYATSDERWTREQEHWSGYFLVNWQFLESWDFTLEGRYVSEDLNVSGPGDPDGPGVGVAADTVLDPYALGNNSDTFGCIPYDPDGAGPIPPYAPPDSGLTSCVNPRPVGVVRGKSDDSYFVPKGTLRWIPSDDMTYYFSVAQAAKPAGIAALTGGPGAFDPVSNSFDREDRIVYELGAKTRWLDNSLQVNGAIFYDDYSGKQVSTQVVDPTTNLTRPATVNGGDATVKGLELEVAWQATENLFMSGSYTYLDTEWDKFEQRTRSPSQIAYAGNCRLEIIAVADGADADTDPEPRTQCVIDFQGNQLTYAPENAFVGTVNYTRNLTGETDWFVETDFQFQDERFVNDANTLALDSYWLANLRAGILGERWDLVAYVDNVFDDDTIRSGLDNIDIRYLNASASFTVMVPNGARALLPDPRSYGLRVNYRFGSR